MTSASSNGLKHVGGMVWKIQGYALVLFTFATFLPRFFHFQEYLFFVLLAGAIAAAWQEGSSPWARTPLDLPFLLFALWILLTIPFAIDPAYSFAEWRKLVTQVLVFYWSMLVLQHQRSETMTHYILAAVVLGTLLLSSYAVTDFVIQGGTWKERTYRARAPYSDYHGLSTYLVLAIPVVIAAGFIFRTQFSRVAAFGTVGVAILAQVLSYTRAGWLGTAIEGIAFGLFTKQRRWIIWAFTCCFAILIGIAGVSRFGYQQEIVSDETLQVRLILWEKGLREIAHHPVVGLGYGNDTFVKRFGDISGIGLAGSHSLFLMVAFGSGIPALILLLWVLVKTVHILFTRAKPYLDADNSVFMIGVAVMIVGVAVRNLFDYMFASRLAYLFWVLVATGLSIGRNTGGSLHEERDRQNEIARTG